MNNMNATSRAMVNLCKSTCIEAHKGFFRRGSTVPYSQHPIKVASRFKDNFYKCIAYLHDVIEDTSYTRLKLLDEIGISAGIVYNVSWLTRDEYEGYFDYIKRIKLNPICVEIKIADIIDNLTDNPTKKQIDKYYKALKILCGINQ